MRKAVVVAIVTGVVGFGGAALTEAAEAATVHHPTPGHAKKVVAAKPGHHKHHGKVVKIVKKKG